ncbi:MAG: ATP-dependent zinc metalloprotease FtsH [Acidobacteria bacterium]|nr:ATP-dependent zinc metalloprotease FtsH [Acidobacteriota bacterium]
MNSFIKNILFWLVVGLAIVVVWRLYSQHQPRPTELTFSEFFEQVESGEISEVVIRGPEIEGQLKSLDATGQPRTFQTYAPEYDQLVDELRKYGIKITAQKRRESNYLITILSWAPILIFAGIWIFFMRQMQSGGNKALSFGKSKARLSSTQGKKVTFNDVAGVDEAKGELEEIIEFLKEPQKFQKLGGKIPKGVLLMGPPGTGKTLLAKAISGEANVPFYSISGSDFVEMFVGVGASRVRDLFEQGKKHAPCLIFIDELDAVGRHRGAGLGGGHDEREQTLNQLLVEMDGFESNEGVILISATNRPDVLDPALLRPGRFDRRVVVSLPDVRGREEILKVHTRKVPLGEDVDLAVMARGTPGFSGADIANLVNEAALNAARYLQTTVNMRDFETSKDKVLMGSERKSLIITEEEKRVTAYHEAGHALLALLLPDTDPLHKVTIIPRGMALGVTQQLPTDDRHNYNRAYLDSQIAVLMGGRVSEEIFLDNLSTGAGNDFERATELARKMVCEWGMSQEMGPIIFGKKEEQIFLGKELSQRVEYSEKTADKIDTEIRKIVIEGYEKAKEFLTKNRDSLERIAATLLEREVLDGKQVAQLARGETLAPIQPDPPLPPKEDPSPAEKPDAEKKIGQPPVAADPLKQPG